VGLDNKALLRGILVEGHKVSGHVTKAISSRGTTRLSTTVLPLAGRSAFFTSASHGRVARFMVTLLATRRFMHVARIAASVHDASTEGSALSGHLLLVVS